jgi:hypothetical protein
VDALSSKLADGRGRWPPPPCGAPGIALADRGQGNPAEAPWDVGTAPPPAAASVRPSVCTSPPPSHHSRSSCTVTTSALVSSQTFLSIGHTLSQAPMAPLTPQRRLWVAAALLSALELASSTPTVTATAPAIVEGNAGTTPATFTVQLSAASVSERSLYGLRGPGSRLRGPCSRFWSPAL